MTDGTLASQSCAAVGTALLRVTPGSATRRGAVPVESYIDEKRRRMFARVIGDVALGEINEAISRSLRDPRFRRGFDVLTDHTAIGVPLTTPQAHGIVDHLESFGVIAGARWAVVTTKASSYGMMRVISALVERIPIEVQIFTTVEEAEAWLDSSKLPRPQKAGDGAE